MSRTGHLHDFLRTEIFIHLTTQSSLSRTIFSPRGEMQQPQGSDSSIDEIPSAITCPDSLKHRQSSFWVDCMLLKLILNLQYGKTVSTTQGKFYTQRGLRDISWQISINSVNASLSSPLHVVYQHAALSLLLYLSQLVAISRPCT